MNAGVIVAGAGPAGLTLAAELRLAGVDVIVLERLLEPTGESRGLGFTARTMEVFDQRGLLPRLGEIVTSDAGHYGGLKLDFGVVKGAHWGGKDVPQARTEEMLSGWALELGADIRRGHELTALTQDEDGVDAEIDGPDGPYRLRASYLVGCDGGRSTVRKQAGFDFPGTAATLEMFIADVKGAEIEPRWTGETRPNGMVMAGPLNDEITRIVVCEKDNAPKGRRTEPPSFAEIAGGWERLTGQDISHASAVWTTSFGNATRQVTEYRRGRVLLAGDAAHIHLPAGGQGMNTSIQDTANLGWKLAAEVNGWAPEGLLDSYHDERHPVGATLLKNTQAQGLLFLSGESMQPLRDVVTELIEFPEVEKYLVGVVSQLGVRYDFGSGEHPLLGLRMPPEEPIDETKTRTAELLHSGRGVLFDCTGGTELRQTAAGWADRVDTVAAKPWDVTVVAASGSWEHQPTPRHAEILLLLALHQEGMSASELSAALFGDQQHSVTVRAEMSRMRRRLGSLFEERPYRFAPWLEVVCELPDDPEELLPGSTAPTIQALRSAEQLPARPRSRARRGLRSVPAGRPGSPDRARRSRR